MLLQLFYNINKVTLTEIYYLFPQIDCSQVGTNKGVMGIVKTRLAILNRFALSMIQSDCVAVDAEPIELYLLAGRTMLLYLYLLQGFLAAYAAEKLSFAVFTKFEKKFQKL